MNGLLFPPESSPCVQTLTNLHVLELTNCEYHPDMLTCLQHLPALRKLHLAYAFSMCAASSIGTLTSLEDLSFQYSSFEPKTHDYRTLPHSFLQHFSALVRLHQFSMPCIAKSDEALLLLCPLTALTSLYVYNSLTPIHFLPLFFFSSFITHYSFHWLGRYCLACYYKHELFHSILYCNIFKLLIVIFVCFFPFNMQKRT